MQAWVHVNTSARESREGHPTSEWRRISLQDAKEWQANDPDWKEGARQGEHLVEWMLHQTAGISRFLARSVDDSMNDMVSERLRIDIANPEFARLAKWLARETLESIPTGTVMDQSDADFARAGVHLRDETFREAMGEYGHRYSSTEHIGDFLQHAGTHRDRHLSWY